MICFNIGIDYFNDNSLQRALRRKMQITLYVGSNLKLHMGLRFFASNHNSFLSTLINCGVLTVLTGNTKVPRLFRPERAWHHEAGHRVLW